MTTGTSIGKATRRLVSASLIDLLKTACERFRMGVVQYMLDNAPKPDLPEPCLQELSGILPPPILYSAKIQARARAQDEGDKVRGKPCNPSAAFRLKLPLTQSYQSFRHLEQRR